MKRKERKFLTTLAICLAMILALGVQSIPTFAETAESRWDTYSDTWALTDELGRTAGDYSEVGGHRGKQVGIFYHIWHGLGSSPSDPNKMSVTTNIENGMLSDKSNWEIGRDYYWAEPLYGYYDSKDEWVYRKHAQLLTDAGVDFLIIDVTNFFEGNLDTNPLSNLDTLKVMCKAFDGVIRDGGDAPQFILACTFNTEKTNSVIRWYYDNFYGQDFYPNLWFQWEGKPLILADGSAVTDETCKEFFNFRNLQPQYEDLENYYNTWDWLSIYPQQASTSDNSSAEIVSVSVAQNYSTRTDFMSGVDSEGRYVARGRSWTTDGNAVVSTDPADPKFESEKGAQLQETFDRAIELNPDLLFITGWNEWKATNFETNNQLALHTNPIVNMCDVFNTEFSRDIEMAKDSVVRDNFYNQLVQNIRRFKGVSRQPNYKNVATMTIDGNFTDWNESPSLYRDDIGDTAHRDANGINGWHYTDKTGRNDFVEAKIARDTTNLYVYVKTRETITVPTDRWMSMLLDTGAKENWNGYKYATGLTGNTATTISLSEWNGSSWEKVADIPYKIAGNQMEYAIPLAELGLTADAVSFQFKFSDNMQGDDALDWYVSGDCAPNGRFAYRYNEDSVDTSVSQPDFTALYGEGNPNSTTLTREKSVILPVTAVAPFDAVSLYAWGDVGMTGVGKLELFRQNGDLKQSVTGTPLLQSSSGEVCKGTWITASAPSPFDPGEYVLRFTVEEGKLGFQWMKGQSGKFIYDSVNEVEGAGRVRAKIRYTERETALVSASVKEKEIAALTDGNNDSIYSLNMTNTLTGEVVLDLGGLSQFSGFRMVFADETPFTLETSVSEDGKTWRRVNDLGFVNYQDHTNTLETWTDEYLSCRYVKFKFLDVPVQENLVTLKIAEITAEVYGEPGTTPEKPEEPGGCGGCGGTSSATATLVGGVALLGAAMLGKRWF